MAHARPTEVRMERTCANCCTMFCALYSSADSDVANGGLNHDRSADASVTSWIAGCTALLTVPAPVWECHCPGLAGAEGDYMRLVCNAQGLPTLVQSKQNVQQAASEAGRLKDGLVPCAAAAATVKVLRNRADLPGRVAGGEAGRRSWCRCAGASPPGTWAAAACAPRCRPRRRSRRTACSGAAPSAATCRASPCEGLPSRALPAHSHRQPVHLGGPVPRPGTPSEACSS